MPHLSTLPAKQSHNVNTTFNVFTSKRENTVLIYQIGWFHSWVSIHLSVPDHAVITEWGNPGHCSLLHQVYIYTLELWKTPLEFRKSLLVNTLRPEQNGGHFANNTLKLIFFEEFFFLIKISFEFVTRPQLVNPCCARWLLSHWIPLYMYDVFDF